MLAARSDGQPASLGTTQDSEGSCSSLLKFQPAETAETVASFFSSYSHLISRGITLPFWNLLAAFPDLSFLFLFLCLFLFSFDFLSLLNEWVTLKHFLRDAFSGGFFPALYPVLSTQALCIFRKLLISAVSNVSTSLKDKEFQTGRILSTFLFSR